MNFRNRKLVITIRVLLGLMFIFSGVTGLMAGLNNMEGVPEPMIEMSQNLWNAGIFQMIKTTEIIAGLMLVIGYLPALALLMLAPICVGIVVFDISVGPEYLLSAFVVGALTAYLGYVYWDKFKNIFER